MDDELRPARWFHVRDGQQEGPLDLAAIRVLVLDGTVGPDAFVWADGMPSWLRAREVPALVPPPARRTGAWSGVADPSAGPAA